MARREMAAAGSRRVRGTLVQRLDASGACGADSYPPSGDLQGQRTRAKDLWYLAAVPVIAIACLADNYAYAVFSEGNGAAVVVDPSEAGPVIHALDGFGLRLGGLLLTHHHWDHVGGVGGLLNRYGRLPVVAHELDAARVNGVTERIADGWRVELCGLTLSAMHVPGHTLGAVAFLWEDSLFTGDTLFAAGCGRLFEGTAAQMYASLARLSALPPQTKIYPGHEYALRNLAFARTLEPENPDVLGRVERVQRLRDAGKFAVPSTLMQELTTNPFLRCDNAAFCARVGGSAKEGAAALFAELRRRRDGYQS
jgi:hydroxyacylglutathione hydrolase